MTTQQGMLGDSIVLCWNLILIPGYVGWYGCAVVGPFFWHSGDWTRSSWDSFSHPPIPKRSFGVLKLPVLTEFDILVPNSIFPSIFLGAIFSGQRHTPSGIPREWIPWHMLLIAHLVLTPLLLLMSGGVIEHSWLHVLCNHNILPLDYNKAQYIHKVVRDFFFFFSF